MAKAKKAKSEEKPAATPTDPLRVHELLGLPSPYDPPKPPPDWPGYTTFWDPGRSVLELRNRLWTLFYPADWFEKMEFARATDQAQWRQIRLTPIEPGKTYPEQFAKLPKGDEVPAARVLVSFFAVHFLATGEKPQSIWLRCRDTLPSGNRVFVGRHAELGLDLGSCPDDYTSPAIGLAAVSPVLRKRR